MTKAVVVLALHGSRPSDLPEHILNRYNDLRSSFYDDTSEVDLELTLRYFKLDKEIRRWPRSFQNDPIYMSSLKWAKELSSRLDLEVIPGFADFCSPSLDEAFGEALNKGADHVVVINPKRLKDHGYLDYKITQAINRAKKLFPDVKILIA